MDSTNGKPTLSMTIDFERDVLQASNEKPVVVDFWAPWCGPCQILGPLLEKLEGEAEDEWTLVKINTDDHPELSRTAGIRGIPAVKLYVEGEIAAEFTGALPEPILRRWLEEHLPAEWKELLDQAREAIASDRRPDAVSHLERLLEINPENEEARGLLARLVAFDDPDRALELLYGLEHRAEYEAISTLREFTSLSDVDELPEGAGREEYFAASAKLREGDVQEAVAGLISVLQNDRYYNDDGPRRALVALFLLLGERHPTVREYRPVFNRSLY